LCFSIETETHSQDCLLAFGEVLQQLIDLGIQFLLHDLVVIRNDILFLQQFEIGGVLPGLQRCVEGNMGAVGAHDRFDIIFLKPQVAGHLGLGGFPFQGLRQVVVPFPVFVYLAGLFNGKLYRSRLLGQGMHDGLLDPPNGIGDELDLTRSIEPLGGLYESNVTLFIEAKAAFQQVLEDYPDSKERVRALLLLARAYYSEEEYEEAKFHFQKFIELYPAHLQVDRAYFFKAMTDYKMMDLASRDQTHTREALEGFDQLIERFPKSQYLRDARIKKKVCEASLAKNVFEIGKFYYRTGSYQSAIIRLKNLMQEHPNQKFLDEAIFLLAESYYYEQNYGEALDSYKQLLKKYPRSPFALQARNRVKTLR